MENIVKLFVPTLAALTLSAASFSAAALTFSDMYGEPAKAADAERTIVVGPTTKQINVEQGEVVKLKVGSQEFAWTFDGIMKPFDLARIAPSGAVNHKVHVYVANRFSEDG